MTTLASLADLGLDLDLPPVREVYAVTDGLTHYEAPTGPELYRDPFVFRLACGWSVDAEHVTLATGQRSATCPNCLNGFDAGDEWDMRATRYVERILPSFHPPSVAEVAELLAESDAWRLPAPYHGRAARVTAYVYRDRPHLYEWGNVGRGIGRGEHDPSL